MLSRKWQLLLLTNRGESPLFNYGHRNGFIRKSRALLGILALIAAMLIGTAGTSSATNDGWWNIENYDATLCMDIGSNAPGTWVGLNWCNVRATSQGFCWNG